MTASPEVRAKRRYDELVAKGQEVLYEDVLNDILIRDKKDSSREIAPLKKPMMRFYWTAATCLKKKYAMRLQRS